MIIIIYFFLNEVVVVFEVVGCLKVLIAVFMCKKSRYGETLNKNTHPKTCTILTLFLSNNTFIILFLKIHCMKVSRNCFAPDK